MSEPHIIATYHLSCTAAQAHARAEALALEQSVEMPAHAVTDPYVLDHVVARVRQVRTQDNGPHIAQVALSLDSVADEPGQLMNMLFGNCSLQPDVALVDVDIPAALAHGLGGPNHGIAGVRQRTGAYARPLTCTALKPIGLKPKALAALCTTFTQSGIDIIKDDHGWANQDSAPFEARVQACQTAVAAANAQRSDGQTLYAPSLYGHYGQMHAQLTYARALGVRAVLIAPMLCGIATFVALKKEFSDLLFLAHPALAGNRMGAEVLFGKLFRLFGADAVIFPNHGGRFAFSVRACQTLATYNTQPWHDLKPALPTPAGGMTVERVPDMLRDYGQDSMLLIGGGLLSAGTQLLERSRAFVMAVAQAGGHS